MFEPNIEDDNKGGVKWSGYFDLEGEHSLVVFATGRGGDWDRADWNCAANKVYVACSMDFCNLFLVRSGRVFLTSFCSCTTMFSPGRTMKNDCCLTTDCRPIKWERFMLGMREKVAVGMGFVLSTFVFDRWKIVLKLS